MRRGRKEKIREKEKERRERGEEEEKRDKEAKREGKKEGVGEKKNSRGPVPPVKQRRKLADPASSKIKEKVSRDLGLKARTDGWIPGSDLHDL